MLTDLASATILHLQQITFQTFNLYWTERGIFHTSFYEKGIEEQIDSIFIFDYSNISFHLRSLNIQNVRASN